MLSLSKFIKKEIELRENLVGTGFLDAPPIAANNQGKEVCDHRFTCLGEIVEASGFNQENLYVMVDTFVGQGWTFEDNNEYEMSGTLRDDHAETNRR